MESKFNILENLPAEVLDDILEREVETVQDAQRFALVSTALRKSIKRLMTKSKVKYCTDVEYVSSIFELGCNEDNILLPGDLFTLTDVDSASPFFNNDCIKQEIFVHVLGVDVFKFYFFITDADNFINSEFIEPLEDATSAHPLRPVYKILKDALNGDYQDYEPISGEIFLAKPVPQDDPIMSEVSREGDCYQLSVKSSDAVRDILWEADFQASPLFDNVEQEHATKVCTQGTAFFDLWLDESLKRRLNAAIDQFAANQTPDYHPHSNGIVRDIVHPALFSFIRGISPLREGMKLPNCSGKDFWRRKFEDSKYQWLPSNFFIDGDGKVKVLDYINNLSPRSDHEELYTCLEKVFEAAVPLVEIVYNYCLAIKPLLLDDESEEKLPETDMWNCDECPVIPVELKSSLRGRDLQVITKIVDYELPPGEAYEGVRFFCF